jgi:hypothetical protein
MRGINTTTEGETMTATKTYTIGTDTYTEAQCEAAWLDFHSGELSLTRVAAANDCTLLHAAWLVDKGRIIKESE